MRRIYLEIYLSVVAAAVIVAIGLGLFGRWYLYERLEADRVRLSSVGEQIVAELPVDVARTKIEASLVELAETHRVNAVLWDASGELVATAGPAVAPGIHGRPAPHRIGDPFRRHLFRARGGWSGDERSARGHRRRPPPWAWISLETTRGGLLELASSDLDRRPRGGPWLFPAVFLVAIALAAYPVSRRITRGLERLREGVFELGEGDLSARIEIEGRNEVADVARAFNAAAEKIQRAVESQSRMLASASHELRSPLGRLRAAVELLAARDPDPDLLTEAERNIAELDALIEDLLLAARLEATASPRPGERVDLIALAREEAERAGAAFAGEAPPIPGDARLLRRLLRNLLENARRHGAPPISVHLETDEAADRVMLRVRDAGNGVPPSERERIFEPFYRPTGHSETEHGGVGLGLALVAEIATHHGGQAICIDSPTGGTELIVELPLTDLARPGPGTNAERQSKTIT